MKKITLLKLIILILLSIPIYSSNKNLNIEISKPVEKVILTEGEAYKMLYDNQVKANDSILKTIFYALGGLASALILVFASNWWFNDKKVRDIIKEIDDKVKDLNKEILTELTEKINTFSTEKTNEIYNTQTKLQEDVTENIKSLTLKFTDFTDKIRAEIKEDDKELVSNFQKQLEAFNENYRAQISSLNENVNQNSENLKEILNGKEETLKNLIETERQKTISQLSTVKSELYRTTFYMWEARGIHRNALMAQVDELEVLIERKFTALTFYLEHMAETVLKISSLSQSDKDRAKIILNKVPETYNTLASEILEKIKNLETT